MLTMKKDKDRLVTIDNSLYQLNLELGTLSDLMRLEIDLAKISNDPQPVQQIRNKIMAIEEQIELTKKEKMKQINQHDRN